MSIIFNYKNFNLNIDNNTSDLGNIIYDTSSNVSSVTIEGTDANEIDISHNQNESKVDLELKTNSDYDSKNFYNLILNIDNSKLPLTVNVNPTGGTSESPIIDSIDKKTFYDQYINGISSIYQTDNSDAAPWVDSSGNYLMRDSTMTTFDYITSYFFEEGTNYFNTTHGLVRVKFKWIAHPTEKYKGYIKVEMYDENNNLTSITTNVSNQSITYNFATTEYYIQDFDPNYQEISINNPNNIRFPGIDFVSISNATLYFIHSTRYNEISSIEGIQTNKLLNYYKIQTNDDTDFLYMHYTYFNTHGLGSQSFNDVYRIHNWKIESYNPTINLYNLNTSILVENTDLGYVEADISNITWSVSGTDINYFNFTIDNNKLLVTLKNNSRNNSKDSYNFDITASNNDNYYSYTEHINIDVSPFLNSAILQSNGTSLVLTYSENLNTTAPNTNTFTVTNNSVNNISISSISISDNTVTLTLDTVIERTDIITLSYTKDSTNDIQDLAGNKAADINSQSVTNNSNIISQSTILTLTGNNIFNEYVEINGTLIIESQSTIYLNALVINNSNESYNNYGITYINNTFINNGTVRNYGTIYIYGTFNNTTNAKILNYGTIRNYGTFTNAGTFNSSNGTLIIIPQGTFINTGSYISRSDSNLLTFIASKQISNRMIKKKILKSNYSNSGTGSCGSAGTGCN